VDTTSAVDATERSAVPPAFHQLGPLAGPVVEHEALRRADQLAVHHPRRESVDLARHQQDTDLVEQVESLIDLTVEDLQSGGGDPPDHDSRRDAEPASELDRQCRLHARCIHVATHEALVCANHRDHRVGGGLAMPVQQPFGAL
jgi:hypothetical protein